METGKPANSVKGTRKKSLTDAKLTQHVLAEFERSLKGSNNDMTRRLIRELRQAWGERDSAVASLEFERSEKAPADTEKQEQAYAGREKVLVVLRCDGFVEVYCEAWIDCRVIQEGLADETDADLERKMPGVYRELLLPGKLRCTGMCLLRPELDAAAIAKLLEFEQRVECSLKLDELIGRLSGKTI